MDFLIKQEHLDMARSAGACSVAGIKVGASIFTLTASQVAWFESVYPDHCASVAKEISQSSGIEVISPMKLSVLVGSGDGYGSGYGSGSGDGSGSCYGSGYGDGYGDGYGSGYGYGYGSGYGSGDGYGYGYGSGYGGSRT